MNGCSRRFLAVNAVLNGHPLMEAFDGDSAMACEILSLKEDDLQTLIERFETASAKPTFSDLYDADIAALINFFRCPDFALVCFKDIGPILMKDFAESDRNGEVDGNTRDMVLQQVIRDVAPVKDASEIRVSDGCLYSSETNWKKVMVRIKGAYLTYRSGPCTKDGYNKKLLAVRSRLTLQGYKDMTASGCVGILNDILSQGLNPTLYRDTFLFIPDILPSYKLTGTVIALPTGEASNNNVRWLVDIRDSEKAKSILVDYTMLRQLIVQSVTDLSNIAYSATKGKEGLVVV